MTGAGTVQVKVRYEKQVQATSTEAAHSLLMIPRRRRTKVTPAVDDLPTDIIAPTVFNFPVSSPCDNCEAEVPSDPSIATADSIALDSIDTVSVEGTAALLDVSLWQVLPDEAATLVHHLLQEQQLSSLLEASELTVSQICSLVQGLALNLVYHLGDTTERVWSPGSFARVDTVMPSQTHYAPVKHAAIADLALLHKVGGLQ